MFGTTNTKETREKRSTGSGQSIQSNNSLVQGTRVEGTIHTENDIRIDGHLIGSLNCKGKVIIGPSGFIDGDIQCKNAVIEGKFNGLLVISDLLHIKETAHIEGDVNTKKLIVQSGSVFKVTCKMGSQKLNKPAKSEKQPLELESLRKVINH
jgi:cytoskeletal protein CcmA (bactofilin family)